MRESTVSSGVPGNGRARVNRAQRGSRRGASRNVKRAGRTEQAKRATRAEKLGPSLPSRTNQMSWMSRMSRMCRKCGASSKEEESCSLAHLDSPLRRSACSARGCAALPNPSGSAVPTHSVRQAPCVLRCWICASQRGRVRHACPHAKGDQDRAARRLPLRDEGDGGGCRRARARDACAALEGRGSGGWTLLNVRRIDRAPALPLWPVSVLPAWVRVAIRPLQRIPPALRGRARAAWRRRRRLWRIRTCLRHQPPRASAAQAPL